MIGMKRCPAVPAGQQINFLPMSRTRESPQRTQALPALQVSRQRVFLSYRNAMLARDWADVAKADGNVSDSRWPTWLLSSAVQKVTTASELSDSWRFWPSLQTEPAELLSSHKDTASPSYRPKSLGGEAVAVHLIPRLTDVLLILLDRFPLEIASELGFIEDFVNRCSKIADQRARDAVIAVIDYLRADPRYQDTTRFRDHLVARCVASVEASMERSTRRSASSEQFANVQIIDYFLRLGLHRQPKLEQRALRCAVYVSGRERAYRLVQRWFAQLEQRKAEQGNSLTSSDCLLHAKALARTEEGRQHALSALARAEQLLPIGHEKLYGKENTRGVANQLAGACLDVIQVMAHSPDVPLERVLSLLGISVRDSKEAYDDTTAAETPIC